MGLVAHQGDGQMIARLEAFFDRTDHKLRWWKRAGVLLIVSWIAWYGFLQPSWMSYKNIPFPVRGVPVRAGDAVIVTIERCNRGKVARQFLSSRSIVNDQTGISSSLREDSKAPPQAEPGCVIVESVVTIPASTTAGHYHLSGAAQIDGEIMSRVVPWQSESFEVTR